MAVEPRCLDDTFMHALVLNRPFFPIHRPSPTRHLSLEGRKRGRRGVDDDGLTRRDHAHWMRLGTLHLRSAHRNNHMPMSPANPLRATPCKRSHRAQLALRVDLRVVGWRKKIFEFEVEVSGTASGTPHKGEASRRRQSAPSFSASTAPRKRSSSRWRAAACWKSAARVEPAARRRHGRRHGGYGRFCRCSDGSGWSECRAAA